MAMIFQEPMTSLNPAFTIGNQITETIRRHRGLSRRAARVQAIEALDAVGIARADKRLRAYPHEFSGGMRQRVMIAMAICCRPRLLIADEPTTALDVTTQAQILKLIKEIQQTHDTAVLFITHDFGVVADIADRVAVMQWGKVVEEGTADEVLRRPSHPYTRMLIGAVPSFTPRQRPRDPAAVVVLATDGLSKTYAGGGFFQKARAVHAADRVSIEIRKGETLGIVGESGSGKSTVARCIARLIDPSDGHVYLDGDDIARASPGRLRQLRRRVQIVFQDPYRSLNPRRTVGASIVEGPMNYGTSQAEAMARAQELMTLVRLDPGALDRYPHQFSGGQRQRICIARALAMEPELLIADEAVSALDVSVQAQVLDLLDDIRQRLDLAMLFITHDLRVAAQVCDTVAVMHRGKVVEYGTASEVFGSPRHEYTQSLFAAAPGRGFAFGGAAA